MGAGQFRGETMSDTVASILKSEPDWNLLPVETPPRVRELLQRCLEKDQRNRLRDSGDARLELKRSIAGHESQVDISGVSGVAATGLRMPRSFSYIFCHSRPTSRGSSPMSCGIRLSSR